ncbi:MULTISPECIES: ATP-binding protein [unclassified Vibrio]|uniref:ATP-binding protein n=1 Tax=unclassified Vibrio TaxID=2614977 RepID=UPI001361D6BE|nr:MULTISPECIES: DUF3404 domain-containing protein [unclassified Vibrio]NAW56223.1 DUF3404 domain-containing protein [Vibrio sp. V36_P2S2PM302]NAX25497.1 DUF3404 domain-containing protein [Vibrio sp. V38_P2S17PM301]NAX28564.1 DUF3404 domain-containing protein [Vibrio sp. V37_P2S8PM304]
MSAARVLLPLIVLMAPPQIHAADAPLQQWQRFYQQALVLPAISEVAAYQLGDYADDVLSSDSQYPDFSRFDWPMIERLYQLAQTCQSTEPWPATLSRAVEFERALCRKTPLTEEWLRSPDWRHPAGGSYAERYLARLKPDEQATFAARHVGQLTLASVRHPLHHLWQDPGREGVDALLRGYRAYLAPSQQLWLSSDDGWRAVHAEDWRPLADQLGLKLSRAQSGCDYRYGNLCLTQVSTEVIWLSAALSVSLALVALLLLRALWVRYQHIRERRFVLQLLTHELRTPIASLGLTVDALREQFDTMSAEGQEALWRLMADHQRLAQLADTSRGYLSPEDDDAFRCHEAWLSDFFDHCLQGYPVDLHIEQDMQVSLPYYWLGLCVVNLVKNALQHGAEPVRVDVSVLRTLRIEVSDCGDFAPKWRRLWRRRPVTSDNMGVGLQLVKRLMIRMGGQLTVRRRPTRCILELPL